VVVVQTYHYYLGVAVLFVSILSKSRSVLRCSMKISLAREILKKWCFTIMVSCCVMNLFDLPSDALKYLVVQHVTSLKTFLALRLTCKKFYVWCSLDSYRSKFLKLVDDKVECELYYVLPNRLRHGEYKCFNKLTGYLYQHCYYADGKLDGEFKCWYEDYNRLWEHKFYKDGKMEGVMKTWFDNGQPGYLGWYKDDKAEGVAQGWYKNGQPSDQFFYENGKLEGERTSWHRNGQLKMRCYYKGGVMIGDYTEWNEGGQIITNVEDEEQPTRLNQVELVEFWE
jgi:antitoxin component YwqK of YwqJK toxin-antitoxin module